MQRKVWCGQELKVDDTYLRSSHSLISLLLSEVHRKRSVECRRGDGKADLLGHQQASFCFLRVAQLPFAERMKSTDGVSIPLGPV